jgi:hypothetical protein
MADLFQRDMQQAKGASAKKGLRAAHLRRDSDATAVLIHYTIPPSINDEGLTLGYLSSTARERTRKAYISAAHDQRYPLSRQAPANQCQRNKETENTAAFRRALHPAAEAIQLAHAVPSSPHAGDPRAISETHPILQFTGARGNGADPCIGCSCEKSS